MNCKYPEISGVYLLYTFQRGPPRPELGPPAGKRNGQVDALWITSDLIRPACWYREPCEGAVPWATMVSFHWKLHLQLLLQVCDSPSRLEMPFLHAGGDPHRKCRDRSPGIPAQGSQPGTWTQSTRVRVAGEMWHKASLNGFCRMVSPSPGESLLKYAPQNKHKNQTQCSHLLL